MIYPSTNKEGCTGRLFIDNRNRSFAVYNVILNDQ